jgi:hypothetical protein
VESGRQAAGQEEPTFLALALRESTPGLPAGGRRQHHPATPDARQFCAVCAALLLATG